MTGGDGDPDDHGVGSSTHQCTSDDGDGDNNTLCAKKEIDARWRQLNGKRNDFLIK